MGGSQPIRTTSKSHLQRLLWHNFLVYIVYCERVDDVDEIGVPYRALSYTVDWFILGVALYFCIHALRVATRSGLLEYSVSASRIILLIVVCCTPDALRNYYWNITLSSTLLISIPWQCHLRHLEIHHEELQVSDETLGLDSASIKLNFRHKHLLAWNIGSEHYWKSTVLL